jgi:hypothetical protein
MPISLDRIELTDREAALLKEASRLMGEALNWPHAGGIALVEEAEGVEVSRLEVPPETLRLLSHIFDLMACRRTKDMLTYKETMKVNRKSALDELVEASEDVDGYDL